MATITGDLTGLLPAPSAPSGQGAGIRTASPVSSAAAGAPGPAASDAPPESDFRSVLVQASARGSGRGPASRGPAPAHAGAGPDAPAREEGSEGGQQPSDAAASPSAAVLAALLALAGGAGEGPAAGGNPAVGSAVVPSLVEPSPGAGSRVAVATAALGSAPPGLAAASGGALPPSAAGPAVGDPVGSAAAAAGTAPAAPQGGAVGPAPGAPGSPLPVAAPIPDGQAPPPTPDFAGYPTPAVPASRTSAAAVTPAPGHPASRPGLDADGGAAGPVPQQPPQGAPASDPPAPVAASSGEAYGAEGAPGHVAAGGPVPAREAGEVAAASGGLAEASAAGQRSGTHGTSRGHGDGREIPGLVTAVHTAAPIQGGEASSPGAARPGLSGWPAGAHDLSRQVAEALRDAHLRAEGRETHLRLRLEPPHLGEVTVRLAVQDGTLRGEILVSRPEVRAALESQMEDLHERLRQQGVNVGALSVGLGGSRSRERDPGAAPGARPSWGWRRAVRSAVGPLAAVGGDLAAPPRSYAPWQAGSRLDRLV